MMKIIGIPAGVFLRLGETAVIIPAAIPAAHDGDEEAGLG